MTTLTSIGVSDYVLASGSGGEFGDLPYAEADAVAVQAVLRAHLPVGHASLLISRGRPDQRPSRNNIFLALTQCLRDDEEAAIIYFAGHALEVERSLYICPEDFDPRIPAFSGISVQMLIEQLSRRRGWALVILDACRIPKRAARSRTRTPPGRVMVPDNITLILGCSNGERAFEAPSIQGNSAGGVFTYFFLRSLSAALRGHQSANLTQVFANAQQLTSSYVATTFEQSQTPRCVGQAPDDIVFLNANWMETGAKHERPDANGR